MSLLEIIVRKNIYLYLLSKYLFSEFFYKYFHEKEIKILQFINKKFSKKKQIIDIGANRGVFAKSVRMFNKDNQIVSFEANYKLKNYLNNVKKKIHKFKYFLVGASNKNKKSKLLIPYYKGKHSLDALSSISQKLVVDSLDRGIFQKNLKKSIKIFEIETIFKKLDSFKLKPFFIKIDTEGSEHLVLKGMKKTIAKYNPVIMIEKNKTNFIEVKKILDKFNYKIYKYSDNRLTNYEKLTADHLNLICCHKKKTKEIFIF